MKILYVYGSDYSAQNFEDDIYLTTDKVAKLCEDNGGSYTIDNNGYYAEFKLYEFDKVDPRFIDFVHGEIQDYDQSKDCNFYVIEH